MTVTSNPSILLFSLLSVCGSAQNQLYDNFEGNKAVHYVSKTGVLDTAFQNPAPDKINGSARCAKYIRNAKQKYDHIKLRPTGRLSDVTPYASYLGTAPMIKMKIYSTAPIGTMVEIQLGKISNTPYPQGTHSQYQAFTTLTDAWEVLEFRFAEVPAGSETASNEVNQLTLLFDPGSSNRYTFYFDELTGPAITSENLITENKKK
jgi:hypothetical protein